MVVREFLLGPLFKLLGKVFSNDWVQGGVLGNENWTGTSSGISQTIPSTLVLIQQTLLVVLEDIVDSLVLPLKVVLNIFEYIVLTCSQTAALLLIIVPFNFV